MKFYNKSLQSDIPNPISDRNQYIKNMVKLFRYIPMVLILVMCKQPDNVKSKKALEAAIPVQEDCMDHRAKQLILTAILNTEVFQKFLHPELEERLPIRLTKSDFITDDLHILSNAQKVVFMDSLGVPEDSSHRITITNVDCKRKTMDYSVFYPIEGVIITGNVVKKNEGWAAIVNDVGEMSSE